MYISGSFDGNSRRWLKHDLEKLVLAMNDLIGTDMRRNLFNTVKITSTSNMKGDRSIDYVPALVDGVPMQIKYVTPWEPNHASIDEGVVELFLDQRRIHVSENFFLHEAAHPIFERMSYKYHEAFEKIFDILKGQIKRRVMEGHEPSKVAQGVLSGRAFLETFDNYTTATLCWKGRVAQASRMPSTQYIKEVKKFGDRIVPHAYVLRDDYEEAFCDFFAAYHRFDRRNGRIVPNPRFKQKRLKRYGDKNIEGILESATEYSREERVQELFEEIDEVFADYDVS